MMRSNRILHGVLAIAVIASCSDEGGNNPPDGNNPPVDAGDPPGVKYRQVEHLARAGINEALLISEGFLGGYNATAPSFAGVDAATLGLVVAEAKTVLKALYLGACLLNGALQLTPQTGVKPAGMLCHAVGPAIWEGGQLDGTVLTAASKAASQAYADAVFGLFIPDVMRVDTSVASGYFTLCGGGPQGLCGGRLLHEDSIDITFNFLLNGGMTTNGPFDQVRALTGDGVNFSLEEGKNAGNVSDPVPNPQQGHPDVSTAFPYSAAPF
jgi:hypothetical protein